MPLLSDDATRRAVLRRIEDHILRETGNRFERLVLLDADARPLLVKDGSGADVYLAEEEAAPYVGRIELVTHNHPRGTSFTDLDVLSAIALGVREVNAFGPRVRYRLRCKPEGQGWPTPRRPPRRPFAESIWRSIIDFAPVSSAAPCHPSARKPCIGACAGVASPSASPPT